jgi:hypothetical protein
MGCYLLHPIQTMDVAQLGGAFCCPAGSLKVRVIKNVQQQAVEEQDRTY